MVSSHYWLLRSTASQYSVVSCVKNAEDELGTLNLRSRTLLILVHLVTLRSTRSNSSIISRNHIDMLVHVNSFRESW